jgi:hypothetical protein
MSRHLKGKKQEARTRTLQKIQIPVFSYNGSYAANKWKTKCGCGYATNVTVKCTTHHISMHGYLEPI